jgi:hypothetical protein
LILIEGFQYSFYFVTPNLIFDLCLYSFLLLHRFPCHYILSHIVSWVCHLVANSFVIYSLNSRSPIIRAPLLSAIWCVQDKSQIYLRWVLSPRHPKYMCLIPLTNQKYFVHLVWPRYTICFFGSTLPIDNPHHWFDFNIFLLNVLLFLRRFDLAISHSNITSMHKRKVEL